MNEYIMLSGNENLDDEDENDSVHSEDEEDLNDLYHH